MHGYWRAWMTIWCLAIVGVGAVLAGAALPATDGCARFYFQLVSGFGTPAANFDPPAMRLAVAVLGAVLVGWGLTMLGLVCAHDGPAQPWRSLTAAIAVWFTIDSALSIASGYPLNAAANVLYLATYVAPVIGSGVLLNDRPASPAIAREVRQR
ncbi:MAG: hypothetical protein NVSMB64_30990 [Candidatus Velthaea sp.]